jgi:hypothetical protein
MNRIFFYFHPGMLAARSVSLLFVFLIQASLSGQSLQSVSAWQLKLDSLKNSTGVECHFAGLYQQVTVAADNYIETLSGEPKQLMRRLQAEFAGYFLRAVSSFKHENKTPVPWQNYFSSKASQPLQYVLMGANGHINGDSWQVLTTVFSPGELQELKPYYRNCTRALAVVFDSLYDDAVIRNRRIRAIHSLSWGMGKWYGRHLLKKWRNRQWKLAEFYFTNPEKFTRLKKRIDKKMRRTDLMVLKKLSR